jgi:hypothetical protein
MLGFPAEGWLQAAAVKATKCHPKLVAIGQKTYNF